VALALLVWGASCSSSSNSSTDPTTGAGGSKAPIAVDLTAAGCAPSTLQVDAGTIELLLSNRTSSQATRFQITNGDGRVIADVSNVLGGLTRTVKAKLDEGSYTMTCGSNAGQIIASAP
jgi:iron uptake system EfeUOB component EfeO/EfeM